MKGNDHSRELYRIFGQLIVAYIPIYAFFITGIISLGGLRYETIRRNTLVLISSLVLLFLLIVIMKTRCFNYRRLGCKLGNNWLFLVLIILAIIIRIPQLGTMPKWDSNVYYDALITACENIDLNISQYISDFTLASHPSLGYASLAAIFEFILPKSVYSVQLFQLLLSIIVMYCIYSVINSLQICSKTVSALGAFVVTCTPLFLGTYCLFYLDFGIPCFLVILLYCHINKYYILMFFSALLLTQTKEVGTVVLCGYFAGFIIHKFFYGSTKEIKNRIKSVFSDVATYVIGSACVIGVFYLVYTLFLSNSGWGNVQYQSVTSNSNAIGYFTLNFEYAFYKIKQMLCMNFSWLAFAVIFISIIYLLVHKRSIDKNGIILELSFSLFAFVLFSCVYYTYTLYRYNVIVEIVLWFVAVVLLIECWNHKSGVVVLQVLIAILLVIQSYFTIDPVTISQNYNIETGKATMVLSNIKETTYYGDYLLYNYQFSYVDKGVEKCLRCVEFDENTDIILYGTHSALFIGGYPLTKHKIFWNSENNRFTMQESDNTIALNADIVVHIITSEGYLDAAYNNGGLHEKAVLILIPYYDGIDNEEALGILGKYYDIVQSTTIDIGLYGTMTYVEMELK